MIPTAAFSKITELNLNQFLKTQGQEGDFEYILVQRHESSSSGQRTRGLKLDDGGIAPFKYSVTYRCSRHGKARLNNLTRIRKVESKKLGITIADLLLIFKCWKCHILSHAINAFFSILSFDFILFFIIFF